MQLLVGPLLAVVLVNAPNKPEDFIDVGDAAAGLAERVDRRLTLLCVVLKKMFLKVFNRL